MEITRTKQDIIQYFTDLPPDQIDQGVGVYRTRDPKPCCVGAHLAHLFQAHKFNEFPHQVGADALARQLGGTRAHLILMLRQCGAGHDPFDQDPWPVPAAEVFQQLATIETLPSLVGANLFEVDLSNADLRGADLGKAQLAFAFLRKANLEKANLRKANLHGANLWRANLRKADLREADLYDTNLRYADLCDADLQGIRHLNKAYLYETSLRHAQLREADLRGINLRNVYLYETKR